MSQLLSFCVFPQIAAMLKRAKYMYYAFCLDLQELLGFEFLVLQSIT